MDHDRGKAREQALAQTSRMIIQPAWLHSM